MVTDSELLRRYAGTRDEAAFAEVVQRHVDMVYVAALRLLNGDALLAEDVAQTVFTEMARQAPRLCEYTTLAGWLHTTTRFLAIKTVRTESRRRTREQEASTTIDQNSAPEISWERMRPLLDDAVGQLAESDRDAVLLRFFEGKSHREVGAALNLSEDAARMRVDRALNKLREQFSRLGATTTAALLSSVLGAQVASVAVPAVFRAGVAGRSLAGVGRAGFATCGVGGAGKSLSGARKLLGAVTVALILVVLFMLFTPSEKLPPSNTDIQASKSNASSPVPSTQENGPAAAAGQNILAISSSSAPLLLPVGVTFAVVKLGAITNPPGSARVISSTGQLVGELIRDETPPPVHPTIRAFLYQGGRLEDLGDLGGQTTGAFSINDNGQIVGVSDVEATPLTNRGTPMWGRATHHAFLYSAGRMQDLGTFGGKNSNASDINSSGQIVGVADTANPPETHAFLFSGGKMQDIGTLGGKLRSAYAINTLGQVAGVSETTLAVPATGTSPQVEPPSHVFIYDKGKMHDVGTLGGKNSTFAGLNDAGQVAGTADVNFGIPIANGRIGAANQHAFLYSNGKMEDLGTLGGKNSFAVAINSAGQVVGSSQTSADPGLSHAFLFSGGKMQDLGTLGGPTSYARAINSTGQVIGSAQTAGSTGESHAFLVSGGRMQDLNVLVNKSNLTAAGLAVLTDAVAINDHGIIVCLGLDAKGKEVAFLLLPEVDK